MKSQTKYLSPKLELTIIQIESSICSSSANVSGGDATNNYQPKVESWESYGSDKYDRTDI